jgi:hypothetical protein
VSGCANSAYNYYESGSTAGSSSYPHTYNNYEGFDFPVSGPYQEFPLNKGGYTGGLSHLLRRIFLLDLMEIAFRISRP